ncbi:MAG: hotdog fold thioesterase, partial [Myxococcota bacterium]|nr:hotdog fold thioesterase [Myxococcota bacterium]
MTDLQSLVTFCEEGIPFNRLLGIRVREITEGRCELEIPVRDELIGDPDRPALHGGVTSALADAAGGFAVWSMLKDGDRASTVDIRVDYLRPGRLDRNIQA